MPSGLTPKDIDNGEIAALLDVAHLKQRKADAIERLVQQAKKDTEKRTGMHLFRNIYIVHCAYIYIYMHVRKCVGK